MKRITCAILTLALCASLRSGFGADEEAVNAYGPSQGLVVHEWGVTHVHANGSPVGDEGAPAFAHRAIRAEPECQKKPVLFFYGQDGQKLNVSVTAKQGTFVSWYPAELEEAAKKRPVKESDAEPDSKRLYDPKTRLVWDGLVLSTKPAGDLPPIDKDHWWAACRKTDASYVRVGGETERFVFYDGAGIVDLKATCQILPPPACSQDGRPSYSFHNQDKRVLSHVFLVDTRTQLCAHEKNVAGDKAVAMQPADFKDNADALKNLKTDFRKALAQAGLYDKEIETFMASWEKTIFEAQGARFVYFLPQEEWDALAPLAVSPKPAQVKRVMAVIVEL